MANEKLDVLAKFITHNPKLRADYFENPGNVLARAIPRRGLLERISLGVPERTRALRAELADRVVQIISQDPRLISAREGSSFLNEALRNPQRTFDALVRLSIAAFLISTALVAGAFLAAILGSGIEEKAVLGGLSGGGGVATTLGTVFAISRDTIRKANSDDARLRLIFTGFGTEITHLRAIPIKTFRDAKERNNEIRGAMIQAVKSLARFVAPEEVQKQPDTAGDE